MIQMTAESHAVVAAFAIPLTSMDKSPGLQNASKDNQTVIYVFNTIPLTVF